MNLKTMGMRIRARREYLKLRQDEVAERINTSRSNYTKYEAGGVDLNVSTLEALAVVLEVPVSYLFEDEHDPNRDDPLEAHLEGLPYEVQEDIRDMVKQVAERQRRRLTTHGKQAE